MSISKLCIAIGLLVFVLQTGNAIGQTSMPSGDDVAMKGIDRLRLDLIDSFNKGDVDRLLSHVDTNAVVTWQNGEVCHGPEAVRAYYNKMIKGDHPIVAKLSTDPVVEDRHIYGDWAVSAGNLHDTYELTDGSTFKFDSHFTVTIAKRGDGWKIVSFHASVNAFENPILAIVAKKTATWVGLGAGIAGLVVGFVAAKLLSRRKRAAP